MKRYIALLLSGFIPFVLGILLSPLYKEVSNASKFPIIGIIFLIGWGYLSNRFYSPNSSMVLTCFLINWIGVLMILCSGIMNCLSKGPLFYFLFDMIRTFFLTTHIIGTMANSLVKNLLPFNFYSSISCAFMIMLFSSLLGCIIKDSKQSDTSSF